MAIFERKTYGKLTLDDTEALKVTIESTQNVQGHTEYVMRVQRGPKPDRCWHVCKRYNDFATLHGATVQVSGVQVPLPPKKLLGNMDRDFIAQRQQALQLYLNKILMNPILASSLGVRSFLDPGNYSMKLLDQASQQVAMALRSEQSYDLLKPLEDVGWRLRKHYFSVRSRLNPCEMVLAWVEYGPDKYLDEKDISATLKALSQVYHPHIASPELTHVSDSGSFVIRKLYPDGTLRDLICGSKPKTAFLKKYGNPKFYHALPVPDIAQYGRQVLDALAFLHEKDIPYGHLHTGNILVSGGEAQLLDIENGLLGLPSYYRPFFIQHRKINTLTAIDVYCFGHVLYEMVFGQPLHESVCDILPPTCPPSIREILGLILSPESLRSRMPTVSELQANPFFASRRPTEPVRINLKLSSSLREALKQTARSIESRLHNEQKIVRSQKKIAKVQELLSSEEEMKKRKQRLREERKANHANNKVGNKSPPRSDSPTSTSTSTATSAGTVTPPLFIGNKPVASLPTVTTVDETSGRSALLDSICSFNKGSLRPQTMRN